MSTTQAALLEALRDLLRLYDQRIPLRERPAEWEAARAALRAAEAAQSQGPQQPHNPQPDGGYPGCDSCACPRGMCMQNAAPPQPAPIAAQADAPNIDARIAAIAADRDYWREQALAAQAAPTEPVTMPSHWSVSVTADGDTLVSIGNDWLSGSRALEQYDERVIIGAAQHLLSFVGYGLPPCNFDPDADGAAHAGPAQAPSWWKCPTHGPAKPTAWGCPDCVRELREECAELKRAHAPASTRPADASSSGQRVDMLPSGWREIVEQLIACHDEPTCPAVAVAREWLAAAPQAPAEPAGQAGEQDQLRELLQAARGALADIAHSEDLTHAAAKRKAARVYAETDDTPAAREASTTAGN